MKLSCNNLTVSYNRYPAIHHLNVEFKIGCTSAIIGPNGAGKTTLIKAILGLVQVESGLVEMSGITHLDIAYLPQFTAIDSSVPLQVKDVVALGDWVNIGKYKSVDEDVMARINLALTDVGLQNFANRYIDELSRGQLQRVLFARIIMQNAKVIILDEPFNAMDMKTIEALLGIIKVWERDGKTVLAVLHDLQQVTAAFSYVLLLAKKKIAYDIAKVALSVENLSMAYNSDFSWLASDVCESK